MTGLDTNVLVRYLAQDDIKQSARATQLIEGFSAADPGYVSTVVLAETVWVLTARYGVERQPLETIIETLLRTETLLVERAEVVWRALRRVRQAAGGFVDALVAEMALDAGCDTIHTFDRGAAKHSGMTLLA